MPETHSWTFHITTLGCKVNQYESQAIREAWAKFGGQEVGECEQADICLVNSCAITAKGERDTRNALYRLHRAKPEALRILTGCAALLVAKTLQETEQEHIYDVLFPATQKTKALQDPRAFLPHLQSEHAGANPLRPLDTFLENQDLTQSESAFGTHGFHIQSFQRARPVLKVQDGCSHKCTYCIVPLVRGKNQSRPLQEILDEARRLLLAGHGEIMLSGINLHQYGRDNPASEPQNFWELLRRLCTEFAPEFIKKARFRISSLEPAQLQAEGIESLQEAMQSGMLCPHIHLSLQHASPRILKAMGRGHYNLEALEQHLSSLKKSYPLLGLGADILMGFPGEEEEDVRITLEKIQSLNLNYAHVFPYSKRPGTAAANFAKQVPAEIKQERAARVREQVEKQKNAFLQDVAQKSELFIVLDATREVDPQEKCSIHTLQPQKTDAKKFNHLKEAKAYKGIDAHYAPCRIFLDKPLHGIVAVRPLVVMDNTIHCLLI